MKFSIKPNPDFSRLEKVLRRGGEPDRVPFFELLSNLEKEALALVGLERNYPGGFAPQPGADRERDLAYLRRHIDHQYHLGYDYISLYPGNFKFPRPDFPVTMTTEGERDYIPGDYHVFADRAGFERYAWPDPAKIDYWIFEAAGKIIPSGMKALAHFSGILENVMWLLGFEGTSYLLFDDPDLVRDTFESVATRIIEFYKTVSGLEVVGGLVMGDDMGYKTQTMLSPEVYREFLFPWHRRLVEAVHASGKPVLLHACGNLKLVMDDIIGCGWDARHSFEDVIEPVWEAKAKYGSRIAVLGGFDLDLICRSSPEQVRAHTRRLVEACAPGGGWALGTGNSVASYVPVRNYLAMLDEGYRAGWY